MVTRRPLRVVFFGTPAFAVPTLDALLARAHRVVGVVTQPDRPRGRGQKTTDAPVKARAPASRPAGAAARRAQGPGVPRGALAPARRPRRRRRLRQDPDRAVLADPAARHDQRPRVAAAAYRGAAPVHRAVIAGERETGVTIMRVVKALDAGPMLAAVRRPIGPDDTSDEVERDWRGSARRCSSTTLDRLAAGPVDGTPQDDATATYAPRLTKDDGIVDWTRAAHARFTT